MKLTRREERLFDELACYTCFGTDYPYEKQRKMHRLIVGGAFVIVLFPSIFILPVF